MAENFTREFADKLLARLSDDEAFRTLFAKDAREALRQLGYETPKEDYGIEGKDPVLCCQGGALALATPEKIAAAREELQSQLSSSVFHYTLTL